MRYFTDAGSRGLPSRFASQKGRLAAKTWTAWPRPYCCYMVSKRNEAQPREVRERSSGGCWPLQDQVMPSSNWRTSPVRTISPPPSRTPPVLLLLLLLLRILLLLTLLPTPTPTLAPLHLCSQSFSCSYIYSSYSSSSCFCCHCLLLSCCSSSFSCSSCSSCSACSSCSCCSCCSCCSSCCCC